MADTMRSVTALQSLLADNVIAAISPQDLRDFLVSAAPSYGFLASATSAATTVSVAGTYYKAAGTTTAGDLKHFDSPADNQLRYTGPENRIVSIHASFSMTTAGSNDVLGVRLAINGTTSPLTTVRRKVGTGADVGAASCNYLVQMAQNDYVEVFVTNEDAAATVTLEELNLTAIAHMI